MPDAIPRELTDATSWYPVIIRPKAGKVGAWDKIPGDPRTGKPAIWSDPATRCTFGAAFMAYESRRFQGVGYMMSANAGVVGIDLDKCRDPETGVIAPWAQEIVEAFPGAYWERSISGTGLRGFCRATLSVGGCRSKIEGCSVELYADQRFLVVTGQALAYVEALPDLQAAVDALYARLTVGRVRATGTAVGSGLTGRAATVPPEGLAILEAALGDRHGARMLEIWSRDELHVTGASEDDWALACELVYQGERLGHSGLALAQLVEETMRGGPYRAKWDDTRGGVTWLAQDIANAIATVTKRLGDRPASSLRQQVDGVDGEPIGEVPADETIEEKVARLERELAQARSVTAVQMTNIRALRVENDEYHQRARETAQVFRNRTLGATEKLLAIVAVWLVESGTSRGAEEIRAFYPDLAEAAGVSESTVGRYMAKLTDGPNAPLAKRTETEWRTVTDRATGQEVRRPTSATFLCARGEGSILAAVANYHPENRPRHGGKRLPRCPEHPNADIIIRTRTHCATCRKPIGEAAETLRRQVAVVEDEDGSCVRTGVNGQQVAVVGGHDGAELESAAQGVVPIPIPIEQARAERLRQHDAQVVRPPTPVRWRCACGSLERHPADPGPGERFRCEGCGRGWVQPAMQASIAGGSE